MEKIALARLVSYVGALTGKSFDTFEIGEIDKIASSSVAHGNIVVVGDLLLAIGDRRLIDAIKAYRQLTGSTLKDSKDVIDTLFARLPGHATAA
jgi:ribosomal protein L7/L12